MYNIPSTPNINIKTIVLVLGTGCLSVVQTLLSLACFVACLAAPLLFCFLYKVQKLLYFFSHSHFDKNRMIINLHFAQPSRATPTPRRDHKKKGWANGCGRRFGCLALQGGVSPACHQPPLLCPPLFPFHPLSLYLPPSLRTELDAPGRARAWTIGKLLSLLLLLLLPMLPMLLVAQCALPFDFSFDFFPYVLCALQIVEIFFIKCRAWSRFCLLF